MRSSSGVLVSSPRGRVLVPVRRLSSRTRNRRQGVRRRSLVLFSEEAAPARLSDDERVVALDPAVRGEDEEVEPDSEQLAVLGDRLPVELDDVAESLGVVAPPEAEPLGADPVLVRARRPSLYRLVSLCVRITSAIAARLG